MNTTTMDIPDANLLEELKTFLEAKLGDQPEVMDHIRRIVKQNLTVASESLGIGQEMLPVIRDLRPIFDELLKTYPARPLTKALLSEIVQVKNRLEAIEKLGQSIQDKLNQVLERQKNLEAQICTKEDLRQVQQILSEVFLL